MTEHQLTQLCGSPKRAEIFVGYLNETFSRFAINTRLRTAAFMGQIIVESGSLRYTQEIASGKAYEGRADLGNIFPGDGVKFKGRGLIQVTGRHNYLECSKFLFADDRLLKTPELLSVPQYACLSAGWYWDSRNLNALADAGQFRQITKRINGGYTAEAEREMYYRRALEIL